MKKLIFLFLLLPSLLFSQVSPSKIQRIANASTVFGSALSYGTYLEMQSNNKTYKIINVNGIAATAKFSDLVLNTDYIEAGTVTSVSVATANGLSGTVATATTTPVITLTLGAITPSAVQVSGLTASQITATDASKNLVSLAVATYPSLTELTYVKDVTSAVQTQLNAKVTNPMTSGGDLIYGGALGGVPTRLPNGLAGQVLRSSGTTVAPTWAAVGTVTTVTSANADATVDNTTSTPAITIVSAPKLTTGRTIAITGDLTYTSPSFDGSGNVTATGTIANNAVTYAKIQNVSNNTVLGRIAGTTGVVEEIATTGSGNVVRAASPTFTGTVTAPTFIGALTGNAATATKLAATKNINGVAFDGTVDITVTAVAGAGTLTGTTLASNVVSSSLTSVGTLANLTVTNPIAGSITGNAATATSATTAGTVTAAAQPAITSVGTLTGLNVTAPIAGSVTGTAGTATAFATARTINGVAFDGTANITVTAVAGAGTLTGTTLASNVVSSSLTSVGTLANLTVTNPIAGSITGNAATATGATTAGTVTAAAQPAISSVGTLTGLTVTAPIAGSVTGNAGTATALATPRTINGVAFDGTANITVTAVADAATLIGTTLASTVLASSLTSVGTLTDLTVTNPIAGSITGNATTATTANIASTAETVTTAAQPAITSVGTLSGLTVTAPIAGSVTGSAATATSATTAGTVTAAAQPTITSVGTLTGLTVTAPIAGSITGNAATVTTNANLIGLITSVGNTTSVALQTGTGTTFVMNTSPTLVTPNLGTPSTLVGTNITGTAAGLIAGNVTTNANLTGVVVSTGNSTALGSFTSANLSGALTDETGTLKGVFSDNPTFTTRITTPAVAITTGAADGYFLRSDASGVGSWTSIAASQVYKGTWAASTNTPTLVNGTGTAGLYYRVVTAGTVNFGAGGIAFSIGDDVSYNGTIWQRIPAAAITGAALTKTDDANVIVTLGGSASTSLVNAASITLGWNGILASSRGGTGNAFTKFTGPTTAEKTFTLPDVSATLLFSGGALGTPSSGTATNLTGTASGLTAGSVTTNANLTGAVTSVGNAASLGSFTSANLSGALSDETGSGVTVFGTSPILTTPVINGTITGTTVVPIANGGTNSSTTLNNNRIMVSNAGVIQEAAALTNGQLLIGSTNAAPVLANLTAGNGITITNAAGAITIANTPTIQQAIFTTAITTTSTTYVVATGLTITPGAGDYLVFFSSTSNNTSNGNVNNFSIFSNGVRVAASEVRHIVTAGRVVPVHTNAYITGLGAGQAIDVRWNVSAGTGTLGGAATLIVQRVK